MGMGRMWLGGWSSLLGRGWGSERADTLVDKQACQPGTEESRQVFPSGFTRFGVEGWQFGRIWGCGRVGEMREGAWLWAIAMAMARERKAVRCCFSIILLLLPALDDGRATLDWEKKRAWGLCRAHGRERNRVHGRCPLIHVVCTYEVHSRYPQHARTHAIKLSPRPGTKPATYLQPPCAVGTGWAAVIWLGGWAGCGCACGSFP